jgi:hypothetical protein
MEYWSDLYIELEEKIAGIRNSGQVETPEDLNTIIGARDGDGYRALSNNRIYKYSAGQWKESKRTKFEGDMPEIEHTDLWHDQISFLTSELPFATPAVFIGFSTVDIADRGLLAQECNTQIDFYLFFETFSDTYSGSYNQDRALDFLKSLTRLHALFHGKAGENYSEMRRVDMRREESGGAGNLYRISFQCLVVDYSAGYLFVESENPDAELDIKKGGVPDYEEQPPLYDL